MMNAITLRNLSDEASRALEALADARGTSAETEAERILQDALQAIGTGLPTASYDTSGVGLGTALRRLGEKYPELSQIDFSRDQTPAWTEKEE
jgi:plasmid stability protein